MNYSTKRLLVVAAASSSASAATALAVLLAFAFAPAADSSPAGALPSDYRSEPRKKVEVLETERRARFRYCLAIGGLISDETPGRLYCDLGSCPAPDGAPCGDREVVCDDVEDEHQCGLMAGDLRDAGR